MVVAVNIFYVITSQWSLSMLLLLYVIINFDFFIFAKKMDKLYGNPASHFITSWSNICHYAHDIGYG